MTLRLCSENAVAEVTSLPGCPQVAVIHGAFVLPDKRNQGFGHTAHADRLSKLHNKYLYDAAICTTRRDNEAQNRILDSEGWVCAGGFVSRNTGHDVLVWFKELTVNAKETIRGTEIPAVL